MLKKKIAELFEKIKKTKTSTKIMILLPVISMLISTTAPFIPGLLENRIAFDAVSLFALSLIVLFMILFSFLNRDAILPEKFIGKRFPVSLFRETNTSCHSA